MIYPSTAMKATTAPDGTGTGAQLIDDFLRRTLRVGDPRSPTEIAEALRKKYADDATRLDEEARGLPVQTGEPLFGAIERGSVEATDTAGSRELARVQRNLDQDLTALVSNPAVRDWTPELAGWKNTLLREVTEGADVARFGQDPGQRERAFLAAHRLTDFARVARYLSCAAPEVSPPYRRLARTLDDARTAVLVTMGEAIGTAGLGEGGLLLQVPATDVRQRRDAVVLSLRRLCGTIQGDGWDPAEAAAAYGWLYDRLEAAGAAELRVYLRENMLARALDDLVAPSALTSAGALRGVAATMPVDLVRLRKLLRIAGGALDDLSAREEAAKVSELVRPRQPRSAVLAGFVQTLALFLTAFRQARGGARLVDLALPLPLALGQMNDPDADARKWLRDVAAWRGALGREAECLAACSGCGETMNVALQVVLDTALQLTDRAIGLLAQGDGKPGAWGEAEQRAWALLLAITNLDRARVKSWVAGTALAATLPDEVQALTRALPKDGMFGDPKEAARNALLDDVFADVVRSQLEVERLVAALSPRCAQLMIFYQVTED